MDKVTQAQEWYRYAAMDLDSALPCGSRRNTKICDGIPLRAYLFS
jgi:hypothetical protein